jgi:hypothetical protein
MKWGIDSDSALDSKSHSGTSESLSLRLRESRYYIQLPPCLETTLVQNIKAAPSHKIAIVRSLRPCI